MKSMEADDRLNAHPRRASGPTTVLILDDDEDLRLALSETFHDVCGVECLVAADVASVVALGARALGCSLAILDVNLGPGQPSGLDAHDWLVEHGFAGRVVFLTGHARNHPMVERAMVHGGARVLQKPMSHEALFRLLDD